MREATSLSKPYFKPAEGEKAKCHFKVVVNQSRLTLIYSMRVKGIIGQFHWLRLPHRTETPSLTPSVCLSTTRWSPQDGLIVNPTLSHSLVKPVNGAALMGCHVLPLCYSSKLKPKQKKKMSRQRKKVMIGFTASSGFQSTQARERTWLQGRRDRC